MTTPRLELIGITKRYPSVIANEAIDLRVMPGEIHAVLGENGAGKSTLMKIIYGVVKPDAGSMLYNGAPLRVRNPQEARASGISMVFQHFSLFDTLTVAENVWLGVGKQFSLAQVSASIREKAAAYGLDIDPTRPVHTLSVGEMQRVEIIRALLTDPKLLILDEPTSVLTPQAVEKLFVVLRQLASEGCSILYISHKLHEIRSLCTACTVLRAGKVTGLCNPQVESNASLSALMIGAEPATLEARPITQGEVALQVSNLSLPKSDQFGVELNAISFQIRAGEILGLAGVSGNGQAELLRALSGEDQRSRADSILLFGQGVGALGPAQRRSRGLHFIPEERLGRGAVPSMSLARNVLLTRHEAVGRYGFLGLGTMHQQAQALIDKYKVKASGPNASAKSLSGGNLQKFLVGREIDAAPKVLIVAQPTWGVDVGASAQIRAALLDLRNRGTAILLVSEELEELFEVSDRLMVIAQGRVSSGIPVEQASVEKVGAWMSGLFE
jgi:general nucleoside transport system ATP-binding protein